MSSVTREQPTTGGGGGAAGGRVGLGWLWNRDHQMMVGLTIGLINLIV